MPEVKDSTRLHHKADTTHTHLRADSTLYREGYGYAYPDTFYLTANDWPQCIMSTAYRDSAIASEQVVAPKILCVPEHTPVSEEEIEFDQLMDRILDVHNTTPVYGPHKEYIPVSRQYTGYAGQQKVEQIQDNVWYTPLMLCLFFLYGIVYALRSKAVKADIKRFFKMGRTSHFNQVEIGSEKSQFRAALLGAGLVCIGQMGLFGYRYFSGNSDGNLFLGLILSTFIICLYALIKIGLFHYLGYVFFNYEEVKLCKQSFRFILCATGLVLYPLLLCLCYSPSGMAGWLIKLGIGVLIAGKILFMYFIFSHFFKDNLSIPYLILYLCTIELLPIIALIIGYMSAIEMV